MYFHWILKDFLQQFLEPGNDRLLVSIVKFNFTLLFTFSGLSIAFSHQTISILPYIDDAPLVSLNFMCTLLMIYVVLWVMKILHTINFGSHCTDITFLAFELSVLPL